MKTQRITAKLDHLHGYPVYLGNERIGELEVTKFGWGSDKRLPTQQWTFRADHNSIAGLELSRAMQSRDAHYKKALLEEMERALIAEPSGPAPGFHWSNQ